MARSSQVRSIERRDGVSMVDVVIDDMTIGNPVYPMAQRWRFWASFPGIHIAQFPFRVIENCGVNALDAPQQSGKVNCRRGRGWGENKRPDQRFLAWGHRLLAGTSPVLAVLAMCII
jgi:hypothetical protein